MKFVQKETLTSVDSKSMIWHYMDIGKFLDLLVHQRLFFPNIVSLKDGFEGKLPETVIERKRKELASTGLSGRDLDDTLAGFIHPFWSIQNLNLASCWSMGEEESYALWKVFVGSVSYGVAIQSTVEKVKNAIERGKDPFEENIYMGKVIYSDDIADDDLDRWTLTTTKKPFYSYEREFRFLIYNYPRSEGGTKTPYPLGVGRYVKVDMTELIGKILVSPFADSWFDETIRELIKRISPQFEDRIQNSRIIEQ